MLFWIKASLLLFLTIAFLLVLAISEYFVGLPSNWLSEHLLARTINVEVRYEFETSAGARVATTRIRCRKWPAHVPALHVAFGGDKPVGFAEEGRIHGVILPTGWIAVPLRVKLCQSVVDALDAGMPRGSVWEVPSANVRVLLLDSDIKPGRGYMAFGADARLSAEVGATGMRATYRVVRRLPEPAALEHHSKWVELIQNDERLHLTSVGADGRIQASDRARYAFSLRVVLAQEIPLASCPGEVAQSLLARGGQGFQVRTGCAQWPRGRTIRPDTMWLLPKVDMAERRIELTRDPQVSRVGAVYRVCGPHTAEPLCFPSGEAKRPFTLCLPNGACTTVNIPNGAFLDPQSKQVIEIIGLGQDIF